MGRRFSIFLWPGLSFLKPFAGQQIDKCLFYRRKPPGRRLFTAFPHSRHRQHSWLAQCLSQFGFLVQVAHSHPPKVNMQFCSSFKNSTQCASPRLNQRKTSCSPCVNSSPTVHRHSGKPDLSDLTELNHRTRRCTKPTPLSLASRPFDPEARYAIAIELDHSIGADHLELGLGDEETCDTTANSREQRAGSHLPMQERCRTGGKTMENVRGRQASKKA